MVTATGLLVAACATPQQMFRGGGVSRAPAAVHEALRTGYEAFRSGDAVQREPLADMSGEIV